MPAVNVMERFVETISQANDSGTFDGSFEIKHILSPSLNMRHACTTELNRVKMEQVVRDYKEMSKVNVNNKNGENDDNNNSVALKEKEVESSLKNTPKNSPYLYRKAKSIYQNSWIGSRSSSPRACTPEPAEFERNSMPERASLRSAARMLQFFANKKSKSPSKCSYQTINSTDDDEELDSSLDSSSPGSNSSADTSFEMHAPMLPTFKVTPPVAARSKSSHGRNAASEFARFLRGSFHAKRATVTTLRRSISDSQRFDDVDFTKPHTVNAYNTTNYMNNKNSGKHNEQCSTASSKCSSQSSLSSPKVNLKSKALVHILADTTNHQRKYQLKNIAQANSMRVSHF